MGNGSSNRRNWRGQQNPTLPPPPGYANAHLGAPTYIPYNHSASGRNARIPPDVRMPYYPQGYVPNNGQIFMSMPSGAYSQAVAPPSSSIVNYVIQQNLSTIRHDVNVKKATVHLEKDDQNPGFYLVAFTFDAIVPGSICIFFYAKEGPECSLIPVKPHTFKPVRVPFDKGLGQKFRQEPGTGVDLSAFDPSDLREVKNNEIFPLIVRTETLLKDLPVDAEPKPPGAPLPKSVNAQMTQCVLEMKGDIRAVKVVKQMIWVDGRRYELQEIYGIENVDGGGGIDSSDFGKECVICLSEQRDTAVLPCRHMCMCSECAKLLQRQTNRCPICRTPVEKLLEIKIPKPEESRA